MEPGTALLIIILAFVGWIIHYILSLPSRKIKKKKSKLKKEIFQDEEEENGSLMSKVSRLKRLYNKGTLTKVEFEQAKNKLLK